MKKKLLKNTRDNIDLVNKYKFLKGMLKIFLNRFANRANLVASIKKSISPENSKYMEATINFGGIFKRSFYFFKLVELWSSLKSLIFCLSLLPDLSKRRFIFINGFKEKDPHYKNLCAQFKLYNVNYVLQWICTTFTQIDFNFLQLETDDTNISFKPKEVNITSNKLPDFFVLLSADKRSMGLAFKELKLYRLFTIGFFDANEVSYGQVFFEIHCNTKTSIHVSYLLFLMNSLKTFISFLEKDFWKKILYSNYSARDEMRELISLPKFDWRAEEAFFLNSMRRHMLKYRRVRPNVLLASMEALCFQHIKFKFL